jgi:hypothetical protein
MNLSYLQYNDSVFSLNMEMQKHKEIAKRLSGILAHVIPLLPEDHQASAVAAVERAKSITAQVCGILYKHPILCAGGIKK